MSNDVMSGPPLRLDRVQGILVPNPIQSPADMKRLPDCIDVREKLSHVLEAVRLINATVRVTAQMPLACAALSRGPVLADALVSALSSFNNHFTRCSVETPHLDVPSSSLRLSSAFLPACRSRKRSAACP